MAEFTDKLRAEFGFKRTPGEIGDGDAAFAGFMSFACGDSKEAQHLRGAFAEQAGIKLPGEFTRQHAADFIDWLIVNHWGEEPAQETEVGHA